jgi:bifunctional DNA-binding transcriptional regulator/antitoxin component of YhaV-PrlF toxin-antitoxin module
MELEYEFDGEIKLLEGKMKWNVIYFPYSVKEVFNTNGKLPVKIIIDGHEFEHTLLPSKNGHYLVYNEFIRRALQKKLGDSVHIILKKYEGKREVIIPAYISKVLEENFILNEFLNQPDYIKREQINFVELAKKEETKNNRLNALVSKMKSSDVNNEK